MKFASMLLWLASVPALYAQLENTLPGCWIGTKSERNAINGQTFTVDFTFEFAFDGTYRQEARLGAVPIMRLTGHYQLRRGQRPGDSAYTHILSLVPAAMRSETSRDELRLVQMAGIPTVDDTEQHLYWYNVAPGGGLVLRDRRGGETWGLQKVNSRMPLWPVATAGSTAPQVVSAPSGPTAPVYDAVVCTDGSRADGKITAIDSAVTIVPANGRQLRFTFDKLRLVEISSATLRELSIQHNAPPEAPKSDSQWIADALRSLQTPAQGAILPGLAGVWVLETSGDVLYQKIVLTLRADGTYTEQLTYRMLFNRGNTVSTRPASSGTYSGTWTASGQLIKLSGDRERPAASHDLSTFQRQR
jgi:hypothetical protein